MKLTGSFVFDKCEVVFVNSQVSVNENEKGQVIFKENETMFIAEQLSIDTKNNNSIVINNHYISSFTNSKILNFLIEAKKKNESKTFFINCKIENNKELEKSNMLEVSNKATLQTIETHFQKCSK
jgi:hypothetical protein